MDVLDTDLTLLDRARRVDAVELVRAAGLERATAFTNAVARRLAEGFRTLVDALPEGPLALSYPDWIFDVSSDIHR